MRGSCGDRAVAASVDWIVVEGGSWEVDWEELVSWRLEEHSITRWTDGW